MTVNEKNKIFKLLDTRVLKIGQYKRIIINSLMTDYCLNEPDANKLFDEYIEKKIKELTPMSVKIRYQIEQMEQVIDDYGNKVTEETIISINNRFEMLTKISKLSQDLRKIELAEQKLAQDSKESVDNKLDIILTYKNII